MKSGNKIKQMVLNVSEPGRHEGCLIGNSNTGRLHSPECSAIDMMREDHKIPTDGANFTPCGWCHACGGTKCTLQTRTIQKTQKEQKSVQIKK